jgi:hypothetical protein
VLAPYAPADASLQRRVAALRSRGTPVVVELPGHEGALGAPGCDRRLVRRAGKWSVEKLEPPGRQEVKDEKLNRQDAK